MPRTPGPSPFVGREHELALLHGCLTDAARGEGGVVLVSGEPGIGKTRLLTEFAAQARAGGSLVLFGHSYDGEGMPPYLPFVETLRGYVRAADPERLREQPGSGAAPLAALLPELRERLPGLPATAVETPDLDRFRLFEAVTDLLLDAARTATGGLLLVLEDLHWADAATLALLQHLVRRLAEAPLLLVVSYRNLELPRTHPLHAVLADLTRTHAVERLPLRRLGAAEIAQLVTEMTGTPPSSRVIERISGESDGNPFFATELVRQLAADGVGFGGATATADWRVPEGVRQVIGSRLARLGEPANELLRAAAVLGDGFSFELLAAMSGLTEDASLDAVENALAAGVLHEQGDGYAFVHVLIQQTVEEAISLPRRQRLHLRAAGAIERIYARDLTPHVAALAEHYRLAGPLADPEQAIGYAIRAGEAAIAVFAYERAAALWREAIQQLGTDDATAVRRGELLFRLGEMLFAVGFDRYPEAIDTLERACAVFEGAGARALAAQAHSRLGRSLIASNAATMNLPRGMQHLRTAAGLMASAQDTDAFGFVNTALASAYAFAVKTAEGLAAADAALRIAERSGNERLWQGGAYLKGTHLVNSGRLRDGLELFDRAWDVADRLNGAAEGMTVASWRAQRSSLLDDPADVLTWSEREALQPRQAFSAGRRVPLLHIMAGARARMGDLPEAAHLIAASSSAVFDQGVHCLAPALISFHLGDWDTARGQWRAAYDRNRRTGSCWGQADFAVWLARLACIEEDVERARLWAQEVLAIAVDGPSLPYELHAGTQLALLACARGEVPAARAHVDRCAAILAAGEDWRGLAGRVALAQAVVAAANGEYDVAAERFEQALYTFRRYTLPWEEADALRLWGRVLLAAGDRLQAHDRFDAALAIYDAREAGAPWRERVLADRERAASPQPAEVAGGQYPGGLSAREVDVLRLIAAGKSNREIHERLTISVNTVFQHVRSILNKTGCANRTEAAAYALRHGLVE